MNKPPSKNLPASVRQRLLNHARTGRRPFAEVLQCYAIERFLYRLSKSPYCERFVLKGALVFMAWGSPPARPTRDVDLLGFTQNTIDGLVGMFGEICAVAVEPDGLEFGA